MNLHRPRFLRGERMGEAYKPQLIVTSRLFLAPHVNSPEARETWYNLGHDPSIQQYLYWPPRNVEESARHLRDRTRHTKLLQKDDFLALRVVQQGSLRLIGDVSVHLRVVNPENRTVELGWLFHPMYRGRGYATEAVQALIDSLREPRVGAKVIEAVIHRDNIESQKLAERLGMRRVGYVIGSSDTIYRLTL